MSEVDPGTQITLILAHGAPDIPPGAYVLQRDIEVPKMSDHAMADLMMKLNMVVEDFNARGRSREPPRTYLSRKTYPILV